MTKRLHNTNKGFSLIELLIGLIIGLLATLAISNVFTQFEQRKRNISGGADAQTNGNLALYYIQRDAQNAGFALPTFKNNPSPFACANDTIITQDGVDINLSPIIINNERDARGDTISVRYGNAANAGAFISSLTGTVAAPKFKTSLFGCLEDDVVLLQNATKCSLGRLQTNPAVNNSNGETTLTVENLTGNMTDADIGINAHVACLGDWNQYQFSVNGNFELTRTGGFQSGDDFPDSAASPIVSDIVALQAQYGISADLTTNQVSSWVDATNDFGTDMSAANRNRIKAIRVAVVARDGGLQKNNVSQACNGTAVGLRNVCIWSGDATPSNVDLSGITNWQRYRYRVYETAIPLRNVLWNRDALQ